MLAELRALAISTNHPQRNAVQRLPGQLPWLRQREHTKKSLILDIINHDPDLDLVPDFIPEKPALLDRTYTAGRAAVCWRVDSSCPSTFTSTAAVRLTRIGAVVFLVRSTSLLANDGQPAAAAALGPRAHMPLVPRYLLARTMPTPKNFSLPNRRVRPSTAPRSTPIKKTIQNRDRGETETESFRENITRSEVQRSRAERKHGRRGHAASTGRATGAGRPPARPRRRPPRRRAFHAFRPPL
ncbi:hypothetical protein EVAR_27087_1 [Eumeta japonica]|uniref:Uncharacterized protein n=1 Tax=Eumeta variegata TaxID=151549 RepID=A0A4C1VLF2_EUMVA|nr:hypothetical protein EVAR_27087_1 [Eumeta japonica]